MENLKVFIKQKLEIIFLTLFLTAYAFAGISVSLNRFWQFNSFWYDFGIFDETVWELSRFQLPYIEQLNPPNGIVVWGDHLNPSAILLTPFYWITDKPEIILIAQVLFVVASAIVIYKISRKLIKNHFARVALIMSYLGFVGMQNAIYTDVHNIVFAILPLSLTFWAIYEKRWKLYWLFLMLTLGFQETLASVVIGIGIFLIIKDRKLFKIAFTTIILGLLWGIVSTKIIMPAFAGHSYSYNPTIPSNLYNLVTGLFFPASMKLRAIVVAYATFGFMPILSISAAPLIFEHFLERFVFNVAGTRWDLGFHYNVLLSPIMALATLEVLLILQKRKIPNLLITIWAVITIMGVIFIHRFYYHGPLMLATDPIFYQQLKQTDFLNEFAENIPKNGLIMAQNNIASHLTHNSVILLHTNYEDINPDTVALDLRGGQNANDFFPLTEDDANKLAEDLKLDQNYQIIYQKGRQVIFTKK
ncbi:MAG: hypothetical protein UT84_C0001G0026 [Candidatus Curtissbacteria bacterium GW2011_GWA1_40_16]|uniref:DUF2079 domain-containing protein n=1 Tax=Candidatus Curtissbacteria bacterium GW2011_GWA1_40_16 TaxID=1618405 RepID=A0A0G0RN68_9BACT|nr:MAG: hypothetical protein UT84_C0001G0026 [Candidatus Curtissbacteria bacterium GW2011_GWA1_40_16]